MPSWDPAWMPGRRMTPGLRAQIAEALRAQIEAWAAPRRLSPADQRIADLLKGEDHMASSRTLKEGDWVRIDQHTGARELVEQAAGALITFKRGSSLEVSLYSDTGTVLRNGYSTNADHVTKIDKPVFTTRLSHIPRTPEVQAVMDQVWRTATQYSNAHGYQEAIKNALLELGIEKPPTAKVKFQIVYSGEVDLDLLLGRAGNDEDLWERFQGYSEGQKIDAFLGRLPIRGNSTIQAELIPTPRRELVEVKPAAKEEAVEPKATVK